MHFTGFADEAAADLAGQVRATKELGWDCIEARNIDGTNIHDLSDAAFDRVCEQLDGAGVRIDCFGSTIANWGKSILDPADTSREETERAVARMQRLGTKYVRIMSYAVRRDDPDQREEERFRRVREIKQRFDDAGLVAVHENCSNYGGMSWQHTLRLLENVPGLALCFDTGNPVGSRDYASDDPDALQSSWDFYAHVRDHVAHLHIKDRVFIAPGDGPFPECDHRFPGEGDGDVRRIVADLLGRGYDGAISIEPHLSVVYHDDSVTSPDEVRYRNYVEYGRRMMKMVDDIRAER